MSKAVATIILAFSMLLSAFLPEAAAKDSSSVPSSEDLEAACNASLNACVDACQRGYTDRPETEHRCTDQCEGSYADCIVSVPHIKSTKEKKPSFQKKTPSLGN